MTNNEIVYSIINGNPSLVIHANSADEFLDLALGVDEHVLAEADALKARFLATSELGARPVAPQTPVAAGSPPPAEPVATGFPDNVSHLPTSASPAPGGALPQGVNVYAGPDPKNAQYQMLYVEYPYIRDAAARAAFTAAMKAATQNWWRWSPENKVWLTKTTNEQIVRSKLSEHAHLFG